MRAPAASAPAASALCLALCLALAPSACTSSHPRALSPIPAASAAPLPPLEYQLRSGASWTSHAAEGRVVVLDVWATYCKPCRKAFPKLDRLAAAHPEVVVIGLSVDDNDAAVEAFLREVPAAFSIARDPKQTIQSGPLAVQRLPTLFVIDRRGRIRFRGDPMREPDYDSLPALVATLLAE
jgi:thiol-disulfide isomerase/thioredoxin